MARESCNLDNDEAELLKPSSSTPPPSPTRSIAIFKSAGQDFQALHQKRQVAAFVRESPATAEDPPSPSPSKFSNRCSSCLRRVGLTGFRCRCGDLFCPRHRYSDAHDCSFDYKSAAREQISKANPLIRPAKIIKI